MKFDLENGTDLCCLFLPLLSPVIIIVEIMLFSLLNSREEHFNELSS